MIQVNLLSLEFRVIPKMYIVTADILPPNFMPYVFQNETWRLSEYGSLSYVVKKRLPMSLTALAFR